MAKTPTKLFRIGNVTVGTTKGIDVNYFTTSLSQFKRHNWEESPSSFRIHISLTISTIVEYTVDDGTTWNQLNKGTALTADSGYGFLIPIDDENTLFNLRNKTSSVIKICDIVGIKSNI